MPRAIFEVITVDAMSGESRPVRVEAHTADRARDLVASTGAIVGPAHLVEVIDASTPAPSPLAGEGGASPGGGHRVQTIEQTGKKYKAHMLIGGLMAMVGLIGFPISVVVGLEQAQRTGVHSDSGAVEGVAALFLLLMLIGIGWWLVARCRAWWHHG